MTDDYQEKTGASAYWASNPRCCSRERTPTFATTQEREQHPQSLPRGGEDERLVLTDLPVTTRTRSRTQRQMVQLTLTGEEATEIEVRCECGKLCKNQRGLNIHQSKSKCGDVRTQTQRTEVHSDETQEITSQDSTHSTGDLSASESSHDSSPILNEVPRREKETTATPCKERVS